jgi:hypothetical protein
MCNKKVVCCKKNIHIKRFFLPLILSWLSILDVNVRTYIYLPFVISFGCIFLFWNFPILVYFTNSKPMYYEDMWIINQDINKNNIVPEKIKERINCIFLWILIFTNSILLGALSDYWMFRAENKESVVELLGITGGIIKIFQLVNDSSAKILIVIMRKYIKKKSGSFHIMNVSPNVKDMSPNINIIEIKRRTQITTDPVLATSPSFEATPLEKSNIKQEQEIEMSQIKNITKKREELNEII